MSDQCITTRAPRRSSRALLVTAAAIATAIDTLSLWGQRMRQRRQLHALSDHMLKDLGISRRDAADEARRRFWH